MILSLKNPNFLIVGPSERGGSPNMKMKTHFLHEPPSRSKKLTLTFELYHLGEPPQWSIQVLIEILSINLSHILSYMKYFDKS